MRSWLEGITTGLPRTFWFLWLGTLINRVGIFVLPFLTLYLTSQRNLPVEQATFIASLFGIGAFIAQFIGGYTTDRWGRRPTMLISLFGTPIVLLVLSVLQDFSALALATFALGIFTDLYRPASSAIIIDVVEPQHRPRAFSLRFWAINLGAGVGLTLGGMLARENYQLLFIGDAITTALYGLVILFFVTETRPTRQESQPTLSPETAPTPSETQSGGVLLFVLLITLLTLIINAVYRQVDATLGLAMIDSGLTEVDFGWVVAINALVIVLLTLSLNRHMERHNRFWVMALGFLLIGIGYGVYVFTDAIPPGTLVFALGVVLWTLGEILTAPLPTAIVADISPIHRRGMYQGILGSAYGMGYFVGPALGGLILSRAGEDALWIVCFVTCAIVAAMMLTIAQPFFRRLRTAPPA